MGDHIQTIHTEIIDEIIQSTTYSEVEKVKSLFNVFSQYVEEVTAGERMVFTTLFARIAYLGNKYNFDSTSLYFFHRFRRDIERQVFLKNPSDFIDFGAYNIVNITRLINAEPPTPLPEKLKEKFSGQSQEVKDFYRSMKVVIVDIDKDQKKLYFYHDGEDVGKKTALYDLEMNEYFNDTILLMGDAFEYPLSANFLDVQLMTDGQYIPKAMVIEPDYLFDVTSISSCLKPEGNNPLLRLISKFNRVENGIPLTVGNIANLFLDRILANLDIAFKDLYQDIFHLNPMAMSLFNDQEINEIVQRAKTHFFNIKKTVKTDFPRQNIDKQNIYLEPSFFSREYGIQGRLDLFHMDDQTGKKDIIELKSGSIFRPNVYGLNVPHYIQTLLYDLMIKSTFGHHAKPNNYILYSKLNEHALKYAPPVQSIQYQALEVRNELLAIEFLLSSSPENAHRLFCQIKPEKFPKIGKFDAKNVKNFSDFYARLSPIYKDYFTEYASFIAREHRLAKTGENGINNSNGLAALWLENDEEKEDRFALLKNLTILKNNALTSPPTLTLQHSEFTSKISNFRIGDIVVLYPKTSKGPGSILKNQVFKSTIIHIEDRRITLRLRSQQFNDTLFKECEYWNIEPDMMDSGFVNQYRSLYEFLENPREKIDLWMGIRPPETPIIEKYPDIDMLTKEQNKYLRLMAGAKDYFLLVGPPGTGKTSVMIKHLVERLYHHTDEVILLVAYTNRAVDEICQAIESIKEGFDQYYLRLGSSTNCGYKHKHRTVNTLIENFSKRSDIKKLIDNTRIFVSTISTLISRTEIFKLKKIDRIIVDEASQILDPVLTSVLCRCEKAVLIGDHKQLPAVVVQKKHLSRIQREGLKEIGYKDMRTSLFERLYYRCIDKKWDYCIGMLSAQGRMHKDLMSFPNRHFYHGKLKILDKIPRLTADPDWTEDSDFPQERLVFLPVKTSATYNRKMNEYEANAAVNLVKMIIRHYDEKDNKITPETIGIITPYRAQISLIKTILEKEVPSYLDIITVDTVERYQGSARDIIIISFCLNHTDQLGTLVSLSQEGVDRKLNVAITRAKERLFLIGNRDTLSTDPTYKSLIDSAAEFVL